MANTNLKKIKKDLLRYGRMPQNYEKAKVIKGSIDIIYSKGTNSIRYIGVVQGNSAKYRVQVQFFDVEFSDKKTILHTIPAKVGGKIYWHKKPTFADNPVKLKSTDPDFRFRFEKELFDKKALIGNWRRYDARKEDKVRGVSAKEINKTVYFKVTHPQGGSYTRKTPEPNKKVLPDFPDGGRPFLNPKGLSGFSYPVNSFLQYLVKSELVSIK